MVSGFILAKKKLGVTPELEASTDLWECFHRLGGSVNLFHGSKIRI